MKSRKISLAEARALAIQSQWLGGHQQLHTREDALKTIEHLGYVQIDTLSVVERAHHHVLWSRIPGYKKAWLDELIRGKQLFEYWGHAASFLPMKDYRFSLVRKREYQKGRSHWFEQDKKVKRHVLSRIKREGPLQSKDFETPDEGKKAWYYWKPAKKALEQLFMEGKLMVNHRQGFQKVYDLAAHVLPAAINTEFPTKMEYAVHLVETAIAAHGILTEKEIYYLRGAWNEYISKAVRKLLRAGSIIELKLEGHEQTKFYGAPSITEFTKESVAPNEVHILSPFDNLLIQRRRMKRLFDFDYVIECYLPEHKRTFGYFTLPILYGDRFIARMDPKADRLNKVFYVRNLAFEENLKVNDEMLNAFAAKLKSFAAFNSCGKIIFEKSNQKKLREQLKRLTK
ncbi:MAG TPA: crosslink repair DNA glycosylase YcaQ family protein [Chitinophagales bacterium]|nr:crosslink repair DNA glycosylase YcaQ family protein [Chitinophagales bacterium]